MDVEAPDFNWKFILVGNAAVGKTSITSRHVDDTFTEEYQKTKQVQQVKKMHRIAGTDKHAQLHIWDTLGQEKFKSLSKLFFRQSAGAFLVYDCTNIESFYALESWHEEISKGADCKVVIMVLGNKIDKPDKQVSSEMGREWTASKGFGFAEVSAKTGLGVAGAFDALASTIFGQFKKVSPGTESTKSTD